MNPSPFMDKQIMGLADLMNPQVPSYDFEPIRTVGSSSSAVDVSSSTNLDEFARNSRGSVDSKIDSATRRYSNILEPHELPKVSHEERNTYDVVTVAEVDRTVKKYADNILIALEGVSSRVSQLESRTRHLESSIDELKDTFGNNGGSTDGKLRQLENILREVQTGVLVLRDKQEIAEAQLQLTKLQQPASNEDPHQAPPTESSTAIAAQAPSSQSSYQPAPPPSVAAPPPPQFPTPNAPPQQPPPQFPTPYAPSLVVAPPQQSNAPPPPHQNPPAQFPTQLSQSQLPSVPSLPRESPYYPPHGAHPMQPQRQPQPQPPPQSQHYQLPQYPHQQMQPPHSATPEESAPYMPPPPSQTFPPNMHPPAPLSQPPPSQYYGSSQPPFPSGPNFSDPSYPFGGGSPSHYNSAMMNPSPFSNSLPALSGGGRSGSGNFSRLPTAKVLPQAAPVGPNNSSGNRVPVDDVVDKVATMGFSREQVRATVRKLTENGQSVDLNVVLDKLMNGR